MENFLVKNKSRPKVGKIECESYKGFSESLIVAET